MYIKQIYTSCMSQASYYIESDNDCVIIDPLRDINLYDDLILKRGKNLKGRIGHVKTRADGPALWSSAL